MLILTKSVIALILGFIVSILSGAIIIFLLKKYHITQNVSKTLNERHLKKQGTPTMGGIIFVFSTLFVLVCLFFNNDIHITYNFFIIIFTFICYAVLGGLDDFIKVVFKNNKGLSIMFKFTAQVMFALVFFYLFLVFGNNTIISFYFFEIDFHFLYGFFILFVLVGSSNAVNITDGLDGLCAGLTAISFLTYGILSWNSSYIAGYQEIAIFCFILAGTLFGFLFYNFYPAKIFMGDLGSLALGATLAAIAIILKNELSLVLIGIVYIIETLSSLLQIIAIKVFKRKILKKSPLHHHFEELGFVESDIIKIFYTVGLLFSLVALLIYVWH